jgi:hypothetical protein
VIDDRGPRSQVRVPGQQLFILSQARAQSSPTHKLNVVSDALGVVCQCTGPRKSINVRVIRYIRHPNNTLAPENEANISYSLLKEEERGGRETTSHPGYYTWPLSYAASPPKSTPQGWAVPTRLAVALWLVAQSVPFSASGLSLQDRRSGRRA